MGFVREIKDTDDVQAIREAIRNAAAGHDCDVTDESACPMRYYGSTVTTNLDDAMEWLG